MSIMYLILANGKVFEGQSFGYETETIGELVFNTGMCGYLETLSDPANYGQIVTQTFPLIGNYGVIQEDMKSGFVYPKGYIIRELCQEPSNFRSEGSLDIFLKENLIPGICGIDTRALTKIIREEGSMNAKFSMKPQLTEGEWRELKEYTVTGAIEATSVKSLVTFDCEDPLYNIALIDFGSARSIIHELTAAGFGVTIMPWDSSAAEIAALKPNGVILSDGPGNPVDYPQLVETLKTLSSYGIPTLGLGMGHQLLSLSYGGSIEKMHQGHRGANQPILCNETGKVTSSLQNHGYVVIPESLPASAEVTFINCNDGTCEGVLYPVNNALSVQFQLGKYKSHDPAHPLNKFIHMMEKGEKDATQ